MLMKVDWSLFIFDFFSTFCFLDPSVEIVGNNPV